MDHCLPNIRHMRTGIAGAATAMFTVGTLAGVSALVKDYPVYGGQAVR